MADVKQQLEELRYNIDDIVRVAGTPGLSIGVLHHGKLTHTEHCGRRNADDASTYGDDTIHSICFLTKLVTVAAVAELVHEGVLQWDKPVRKYLPTFDKMAWE